MRGRRKEKIKHERKRRGLCHRGPAREEEVGEEEIQGREEEGGEGGEEEERGVETGAR